MARDRTSLTVPKPCVDAAVTAESAVAVAGSADPMPGKAEPRGEAGSRAPAEAPASRPRPAEPHVAVRQAASLERDGDYLVLRGPATATFLLAAQLGDPSAAEARPVLGALRGRIGPEGNARLPLALLGPITSRFSLVALIAEPSGTCSRTAALEIGPETPGGATTQR